MEVYIITIFAILLCLVPILVLFGSYYETKRVKLQNRSDYPVKNNTEKIK